MNTSCSIYDTEEIELAFEYFVETVREMYNEYMDKNFPSLGRDDIRVSEGSVYWKIVKEDETGSSSVYGFVRKSDGAVFKAASWRAPYTKGKSAIRGYVTDEWIRHLITPHGIVYAQ